MLEACPLKVRVMVFFHVPGIKGANQFIESQNGEKELGKTRQNYIRIVYFSIQIQGNVYANI